MRAAADRCGELRGDLLCGQLQAYYLEHADEEQNHGEWLLSDLASLGIGRDQAVARLPYAGVAALVGSQYYWIRHVHPAAYLGYLAVLESPTEAEFLREVSERTGIPLSSMSCHLRHAELDLGHVAELDTAIDAFPLTRQQEELNDGERCFHHRTSGEGVYRHTGTFRTHPESGVTRHSVHLQRMGGGRGNSAVTECSDDDSDQSRRSNPPLPSYPQARRRRNGSRLRSRRSAPGPHCRS